MTGHQHPDHRPFVHRWAPIATLKTPRQDRQAGPHASTSSHVDRWTTTDHDDARAPTLMGGEMVAPGKLVLAEMQEPEIMAELRQRATKRSFGHEGDPRDLLGKSPWCVIDESDDPCRLDQCALLPPMFISAGPDAPPHARSARDGGRSAGERVDRGPSRLTRETSQAAASSSTAVQDATPWS
jgi:hypothetical protein